MKVLALCTAAVLTLAACGSDGDGDGTAAGSGDGGDGAAAESDGAAAEVAEVAEADITPSPLGVLFGYDNADEEAGIEQGKADEQERQEAVAACMADLGFEYVAWVDTQMFTATGDSDGLEWGTKGWVERYGYGVSTQWFSQEAVGPELVGYEYDISVESDDPNEAIVEALPEAEQEAYNTALWGDQSAVPEVDDSMTEEEMEAVWDSYEPSGCYAEADEEFSRGRITDFYEQYGDEMTELNDKTEADPRLVEFEAGIEACVTGQGIEYVSSNNYWETMDPVYQEISADVTTPGSELTEEEYETLTEEELDEILSQPEVLGDAAKERLAEVQAAEVELAVATYECGGGEVAYAELYSEISAELEQAWLEEHPEVVEQFSDAG